MIRFVFECFRIIGLALQQNNSCLTNRGQGVAVDDLGVTSELVTLTFGAPQGSILGPILFTLYTFNYLLMTNRYTYPSKQ